MKQQPQQRIVQSTSRLISPRQNFQLKYTKSISKESKNRLKTARYNELERFLIKNQSNNDNKKCNTSCNCGQCGKMSLFQIKIWSQISSFESAYTRRKRVFKRFRIAGYAAQFLVFYKSEQIRKHKRQRYLQQFLRNPQMNVKRGTMIIQSAHSHRSPKSPNASENIIRRNATDCFEIDSIKEKLSFNNEHFSTVINSQNSSIKKRQVSLYMEKMLRKITNKKQPAMYLTPLSIIVEYFYQFQDKKMKKKNTLPSISQQISPKNSLDNLQLDKIQNPFNLLQNRQKKTKNANTFHNEYSQNNQGVMKLIDEMKIKHRQLKRRY
ncbi:unnamed protein product [Paramecium pentaurelia]|uniref:Uncharacterized protein n=1 Tax=Paramecium pentaurelia TaxID=43138 RepID=A0A8S1WNT7_9CILI|nr:unnamed protein product [Paramecium pentaurelia]